MGHSGLKQFPAGNQPIDYFNLLFKDNFYDLITQETNKFSKEIFIRPHLPRSRITEWRDLSTEELKKFIGLVLYMGIVKLNRVTEYWNTNEKFNLKFVSSRMSRDRFLGIRQAFHLVSNSDEPTSQNPLKKILPLLEYLHETMESVCDPGKNICIDESMAP
uniref:PiggyBac transposable element-derived protein domain-containing protein n=1 Tax=Clastoptera arizonana TaxID=38151 RepID=A0A1B6BYD3_9HEMI